MNTDPAPERHPERNPNDARRDSRTARPDSAAPELAQARAASLHVDVHGPKDQRGSYPFISEGRFTTSRDARAWADAAYPDSHLVVNVTTYSKVDGWTAHLRMSRVDGVWTER